MNNNLMFGKTNKHKWMIYNHTTKRIIMKFRGKYSAMRMMEQLREVYWMEKLEVLPLSETTQKIKKQKDI